MASHPESLADEIKQTVRTVASETLLALLLAEEIKREGDPDVTAKRLLATIDSIGDALSFPDVAPEYSDILAQELRDALAIQVHRARCFATGTAYEPTAYLKRAQMPPSAVA